ncbi:MAG: hypothetical protein KC931_23405, partial [Candidatus Omnitrophica bacterium]|nr:hypothetical protein [Candidatus Omnitrophota bacterium]
MLFQASDSTGGEGIYFWRENSLHKVVVEGDMIDGMFVVFARLRPHCIANGVMILDLSLAETPGGTPVGGSHPYFVNAPGEGEPMPPPDQNLFIREMIIQQGVPDSADLLVNRQTLIQVRPGRSSTMGRQGISKPLDGVTGLLHVISDADVEINGSPFKPTGIPTLGGFFSGSGETMAVRRDGKDRHYSRRSRRVGDDTLNFVIPPFPSDGRYRFWAEINPDRTIRETDYNDNRFPEFDGIGKNTVVTTPFRVLVGRFRRVGFSEYPLPETLFRVGDTMRSVYPLESDDLEVVPTGQLIAMSPASFEIIRLAVAALQAMALLEWHNANTTRNADAMVLVGEPGAISEAGVHGISFAGTG